MSALSPTQHTKLSSLVEAFDAAIERERVLWGPSSAEQMRAKGIGLADVNAGLEREIPLRDVHALAEQGFVRVATARTSASDLRRGSFGRWLGGSVAREFVTARVTPTEEGRRQIVTTEVAIVAYQLWVVFVDDVAQTDLLPYAGSEEMAVQMWQARPDHGGITRDRLYGVPKVELGIDQATIANSAGSSGHWVPVPSHRPEELGADELAADEQEALRAWADDHAPRWKAALRDAWYSGNYGGSEHDSALQRIRNRLGPSWLLKYRLPVNPSHATKGYRCWVRISLIPNEANEWVATRRADAVSQVKVAVRQYETEGGVESKDPEKPYEVTFAMEGGKLITTKHTD